MSASELLNSFMEQTVDSAEMNTEYLLCPEVEDVPVIVKDYQIRNGTSVRDGVERPWFMVSLQYTIDSQEAREAVKRDEVIVYGLPIFLTVSEEGKLDMDNNQSLARTLKIFDIDIEGKTNKEIFDSFIGCYAIGKVSHSLMVDKAGEAMLDEEGWQRYRAEVTAIGKA